MPQSRARTDFSLFLRLPFPLHIASVLLLSLSMSACHQPEVKIAPKMVVVEKVTTATVPLYGNYIGVTQASLDVEVRARVDGFVEEKRFIEGSAVKAGEFVISN